MESLTTTDLSPDTARELTEDIRECAGELLELVVDAYRGRVWLALGYESWEAWKDGELAGIELPRDAIPALRREGLSGRAIATVTGTSEATVRRTASDDAVERVTGLDGKERPAHRPRDRDRLVVEFPDASDLPERSMPEAIAALRALDAMEPAERSRRAKVFEKWIAAELRRDFATEDRARENLSLVHRAASLGAETAVVFRQVEDRGIDLWTHEFDWEGIAEGLRATADLIGSRPRMRRVK